MARIHTHIGSALSVVAAFILSVSAAAQTPKQPPPVSQLPGLGVIPVSFCFGDGTGAACPCDNTGALGRGCENSALSGGAQLRASGQALLSADTLRLDVRGELSTSLSIVLQGTTPLAPQPFGDGLRCVGGSLTRLYVQDAVNGTLSLPQAGEEPISVRSAWLGDPLGNGVKRFYQVYYRDGRAAFCGEPVGGVFNISNGVAVVWMK
jgi:hypothetical protein